MSKKDSRGQKSDPTDAGSTELEVHPTELSLFKLDILAILVEEARYGLAIKRDLEDYRGVEVNHGRLYPNLDDLVDVGLVEKSERDKRTNEYELTDAGEQLVRDRVEWLSSHFDGAGFITDEAIEQELSEERPHRLAGAEPSNGGHTGAEPAHQPADAPRDANDDPVFGGDD